MDIAHVRKTEKKLDNRGELPTDPGTIKPTEIKLTRQSFGVQSTQESSNRNPINFNPFVYQLKSIKERDQPPASLAGQYSDIAIVDENQEGDGHVLDISSKMYADIPRGVLVQGRQEMLDFQAKLPKPVAYDRINKVKEQVIINVNRVEETGIQDLNFQEQQEVYGKNIKVDDSNEVAYKQMKRKQFIVPLKRKKNIAAAVVQDRVLKSSMNTLFPKTRDNVEIIRRANATSKYVDNIFNATFTSPQKGEQLISVGGA